MFDANRYHGFARLALFAARCVAFWPHMAAQYAEGAFTLDGFAVRCRQELLLARGGTMEAAIAMQKRDED